MYIKYYVEFLFYIAVIMATVGQIAPWLISKPDSVLVVAGFIILCLVPVFLVYIYRRIHNIINNKQKGKANEVV